MGWAVGEIRKRVVEDVTGWWLCGADVLNSDNEVVTRYVELPPEMPEQARDIAAQMCADELAREFHAVTD